MVELIFKVVSQTDSVVCLLTSLSQTNVNESNMNRPSLCCRTRATDGGAIGRSKTGKLVSIGGRLTNSIKRNPWSNCVRSGSNSVKHKKRTLVDQVNK